MKIIVRRTAGIGDSLAATVVADLLHEQGHEVVCADINATPVFHELGSQVRMARMDVSQFEDVVSVMATHKPQAVINLLDNARLHATDLPAAVHVRLVGLDDATVQLSVSSDGVSIPEDVERYLFEPFFSTRSRGTGLGLYICRQLCDQHGASIDYRLRPPSESNRNEFVVNMRRQTVAPGSVAATPVLA